MGKGYRGKSFDVFFQRDIFSGKGIYDSRAKIAGSPLRGKDRIDDARSVRKQLVHLDLFLRGLSDKRLFFLVPSLENCWIFEFWKDRSKLGVHIELALLVKLQRSHRSDQFRHGGYPHK